MNYYDVLFHPTLLLATLLYSLMVISFELAYQHFLHKIEHVSGSYWIAKHIGSPFIHVLLLVALIYMTYPVLYGLESYNQAGERVLPTLSNLLNATGGQTMGLINTLFVVSVLLPLIPVINRFIALILPLQAIAGSAVLYAWLANYTGIEYSLFPKFNILAMIILLSFIAELAARAVANLLVQNSHENFSQREHSACSPQSIFHSQGLEKIVHKSALLIFQVPVLLIYTLNLSAQ